MRALSIWLMVFMAAAVALGDKKSDAKFSPGPASSYASKQSNGNVTVAAVAYDSEELAHTAFGKLDPSQHGVLPVLVIIQNDTAQALRLDHLEVEYTGGDGRHVDATPASEVVYLGAPPRRPSNTQVPSPFPQIKRNKNPLNAWEIEGRAFAAKMLPAHESANGFFYFQVRHLPGAKFYLTGIKEAATGKDILYFDISLDSK